MSKYNTKQLVVAAFFSTLTAVGAFIKIPFPLVPLTLQSFFAILAAVVLPPSFAAMSQISYLLLGLSGLPVFANGGGPAYLLQPTFGYLLSLPLAAYAVSKMVHPLQTVLRPRLFGFVLAGLLFILAFGSIWMYFVLRLTTTNELSFLKAVAAGALVFLPGTLAKAAVITLLAPTVKSRLD